MTDLKDGGDGDLGTVGCRSDGWLQLIGPSSVKPVCAYDNKVILDQSSSSNLEFDRRRGRGGPFNPSSAAITI